jgi:hypothetical protein
MTAQDKIEALQAQIKALKAEQKRCPHTWGEVTYNPVETKGYYARSPHAHVGRHSEDLWVPPTSTPRWTRTCTKCGLTEHTKRIKEVNGRGSIPGTRSKEQVPVF